MDSEKNTFCMCVTKASVKSDAIQVKATRHTWIHYILDFELNFVWLLHISNLLGLTFFFCSPTFNYMTCYEVMTHSQGIMDLVHNTTFLGKNFLGEEEKLVKHTQDAVPPEE